MSGEPNFYAPEARIVKSPCTIEGLYGGGSMGEIDVATGVPNRRVHG
jgi:hypothetical protein